MHMFLRCLMCDTKVSFVSQTRPKILCSVFTGILWPCRSMLESGCRPLFLEKRTQLLLWIEAEAVWTPYLDRAEPVAHTRFESYLYIIDTCAIKHTAWDPQTQGIHFNNEAYKWAPLPEALQFAARVVVIKQPTRTQNVQFDNFLLHINIAQCISKCERSLKTSNHGGLEYHRLYRKPFPYQRTVCGQKLHELMPQYLLNGQSWITPSKPTIIWVKQFIRF